MVTLIFKSINRHKFVNKNRSLLKCAVNYILYLTEHCSVWRCSNGGVVKKTAERRDELLDIALKLFMQKGYANTSVKDIYSEANGSFGMFYHHFKSKEEIFEVAMGKLTDLFIEARGGSAE